MLILAEDQQNPVLPPLGELIIAIIGFGVLCFILMKFIFPRMEATFRARQDAIEGGIKRAEEAQAEAQRLLRQYTDQLSEARSEAARIRDGARVEGQRILDEMREQAREEAARIQRRGEEQLAASRQQITHELRGEIGRLSLTLAERIIGEALSDETRQGRTVDRLLDELDEMAGSVPAEDGDDDQRPVPTGRS